MSANGMCQHNNIAGYCPACVKEKAMNGYGMSMNGGEMGITCQPGYYELKVVGIATGQCLPNLATATAGATKGVSTVVGTGVASSPATQAALTSAASETLGRKIINFYTEKPVMAWGATAAVVALVAFGGLTLIRGR